MATAISPELLAVLSAYGAGTTPDISLLAALSEEDIARIGILRNLEITFSPMSQDVAIRANAQLLQYTKPRPASRIEANILSKDFISTVLSDNDDV